MSAASIAQRAQMGRDVEGVKTQFLQGFVKAGLSLLVNAETLALLANPLSAVLGYSTDNARRVVEGLEAERQTYLTWSTRWRKWAEDGQREDGSAYTVERWQEVGKSIATSIRFWTGQAWDNTLFAAVGNVPHDTATTLKEAKQAVLDALPELPKPEDWKGLERAVLIVGGGLLTIGLLVAVGYAVRSVR